MNSRDFLVVARALAVGNTEAAWRSAVSRAYYAAFHVACELMEALGFRVPQSDRAHAYLSYRLGNCGQAQVQSVGQDLETLRRNRNWADYDLQRPLSQAMGQSRVSMAEQVIQFLDTAIVEPTRTQITDAMKTYERDVLQDVTWHP